jgi:hypothetical protein
MSLKELFKDLPESEWSESSTLSLLNRIRAGYDKFGETLEDYRELRGIHKDNLLHALNRLTMYKATKEIRHLIDAIFYLYRELLEKE